MSKNEKKTKADQPPMDEYAAARQEWSERYGTYVAQARNWRFAAFGAIAVATIAVLGLAVSASQNKLVPYVVEVDNLGRTSARIADGSIAQVTQDKVVEAYLRSWVVNWRSVTVDGVFQRKMVNDAYALIPMTGQSKAKLDQWFLANQPFERAATTRVEVDVRSVLKQTENTYLIEWQETQRDNEGKVRGQKMWRATVNTQLSPPTVAAVAAINPLGLFIVDFNFTENL